MNSWATALAEGYTLAEAPGRVNLLGEHTDYNEGFVLPVAIAQRTRVAMQSHSRSGFTLRAVELGQVAQFSFERPPVEHFARYVFGCLALVRSEGARVPGLNIVVSSNVPIGVGLSSSAALEVATLRCLRQLLELDLDDVRIAQLAQRAEVEYAQVRCGIMDQMSASLASTDRALLIDTRSLERREVPLPKDSAVLVLDSGVNRSLAASGYNLRRRECEQAAVRLGKKFLRDIESLDDLDGLPDLLRRRSRHVFTENARVLQAATGVDADAFGQLMNASHTSLRHDFEVSTNELDCLVQLLQSHPGVYGARLTGAGFGGACVALCQVAALRQVSRDVLARYRELGYQGYQLVPGP